MLNHKPFQFLSSRWHASGTKVAKSGTSSLPNVLEVFLTCFSSRKNPSLAQNMTKLDQVKIFLILDGVQDPENGRGQNGCGPGFPKCRQVQICCK